MKIAQVAPLMESVPPRLYGGTERIVSYLTEALVEQGHDVTLFASGDSITSARLVPCCTQALRLNAAVRDPIPYYMLMLDKVRRQARDFDIIHFHIDQFHFPIFRDIAHRTVTTLHGRQDLPDMLPLYAGFPEMSLVSISDAQRAPVPDASYLATVHHGLPRDLLAPTSRPRGGYMAFIGRISPEKRADRAIRIARAAGIPLRIAAKVDRVDMDYFKSEIEPMLAGPGVEFIGEIDERRKRSFLGEARGLLFPIDWPEPFGLRHARPRLPQRLGARGHRRGRDGLHRRQRGGSRVPDRRPARARPRARAPAFRGALHGDAHGRQLREALQEPSAGRERAAFTTFGTGR